MKKYTWIVALAIALSLVVVGCDTGGGTKKKDTFEPADPIDVKFTQDMLDVWGGGAIVAEGDGSGFTFTYGTGENANHGNAVAMFKVNLGTAKVRDYEKVTFTFTGISGDLGPNTGQYDIGTAKGVNLLAAKDKDSMKNFGGADATLVTYIVNAYSGVPSAASGATINAAGAKIGTQPAAIDLALEIEPSRPQAKNTGEVWFSIYLHASGFKWENGAATTEQTSFKITNVKFVPRETALGDDPVTIFAIAPVAHPVRDNTPVTTAPTATDQWTASAITWSPAIAAGGKFAADTAYTATITLTAKEDFTFEGVTGPFTITGAPTGTTVTFAVGDPPKTCVITAVFPKTLAEGVDELVTIKEIAGLTAPVKDGTPVAAITDTAQYKGTVTWAPTIAAGGKFAKETAYTATVALTAEEGYTFKGLAATFFTVAGATTVTFATTDAAPHSGTITATFPATLGDAGSPPEVVVLGASVVLSSNDGDGAAQGSWAGAVTGNSATWTGGAVRYSWADIPNIADYDFVKIEYTDGAGSVILKQLNTGTDFGFVSNQYPTLAAEDGEFTFQLRGAGSTGGVALQANTGSSTGERTITITKVTFTKGVRVTITFNADGGSAVPVINNAVVGTVLGPLPSSTKADNTFAGWFDTTDVAVTAATEVPAGGMTLKAHWNPAVSVTQIPVNLSTGVTAVGGTLSAQSATSVTFTYTSGYAGSFVKFPVQLATGASLADYGSVTVTINGTAGVGDPNYKSIWLLAGTPLPSASINPDPTNLDHTLVVGGNTNSNGGTDDERYTSGSQTRTIAIAAGKGSDLTGSVELCVYIHAANNTVYTFSNITLNPKTP